MKILIVPSDVDAAIEAAQLLRARCIASGLDAYVQPSDFGAACCVEPQELALVVPMGGDGTFLHAARLIDFAPVPIMGINYGTLGFLSGDPQRDHLELVIDALAGDIPIERRTTLDARVTDVKGNVQELTALNEIAYTRGSSGHVVEYEYAVNGTPVARLKADGLVLATATGSTAYALSAGGPIVSPGYKGLLAVPLAPHTLSARALVTAPSDVVEVTMSGRFMSDASLFVDGRPVAMEGVASLVALRGEREVLMADAGTDFFTNVSETFFGGGGISA